MNKPINVNGVDVSECEFCMHECFKAIPQCKLNIDSFATACMQHQDCYYKQMQRLKAENDGLKSQLDFEIQKRETVEAENEQYKQVLEEVGELANKRNVGCGKFCEVNRKEHNCNAECNAYYLKQIKDKIDEVLKDERTIKIS